MRGLSFPLEDWTGGETSPPWRQQWTSGRGPEQRSFSEVAIQCSLASLRRRWQYGPDEWRSPGVQLQCWPGGSGGSLFSTCIDSRELLLIQAHEKLQKHERKTSSNGWCLTWTCSTVELCFSLRFSSVHTNSNKEDAIASACFAGLAEQLLSLVISSPTQRFGWWSQPRHNVFWAPP